MPGPRARRPRPRRHRRQDWKTAPVRERAQRRETGAGPSPRMRREKRRKSRSQKCPRDHATARKPAAKKIAALTMIIFLNYPIDAITNGPPCRPLSERSRPSMTATSQRVARYARGIRRTTPGPYARCSTRSSDATGRELDEKTLTLGFARRATSYEAASPATRPMQTTTRIPARRGRLRADLPRLPGPPQPQGRSLVLTSRTTIWTWEADVRGGRRLDEHASAAARGLGTERMKAALNALPASACRMAGGWRGTTRALRAGHRQRGCQR